MDIGGTKAEAPRTRDALILRLDIGIYVLGNAAILAANGLSGSRGEWLLPALLGWSVAVGIHALAVLTGGRVLDRAWHEGMTLERMRRYDSELIRAPEEQIESEHATGGGYSESPVSDPEPVPSGALVAV